MVRVFSARSPVPPRGKRPDFPRPFYAREGDAVLAAARNFGGCGPGLHPPPASRYPSLVHLVLPFLLIVVARICDVSMSTLRVAFIARGRKYLAAACGFVEILIWISVVSRVLSGGQQFAIYVAYAVGLACGVSTGVIQ